MFILRSVNTEVGVSNTELGDYYTVVLKRNNEKQFNEAIELWDKSVVDELYGVVLFDDDNESIMPLYSGVQYFIMTESGKTFEKL